MSIVPPQHTLSLLLGVTILGGPLTCVPEIAPIPVATAVDEEFLLTNAYIVDPAAQEVRRANLLIRDGVIVTTLDRTPRNFSGKTVDLNGKWVIPGLNDLHTHSFGNQAPGGDNDSPGTAVVARRLLYAGVTGFLDLFGPEEALHAVREQQRAGEIGGADLFASLSCLTASKGHCTEYGIQTRVIDSPEDARRVVINLMYKRPDVIKIVYQPTDDQPSIDKETLAAAVATAAENNVKTIIHIKTWQDVRDAVDVGASAVTHIPRGPIPDDVAPLMANSGVASIPTLAAATELVDFLYNPKVLDNSMARALTTEAVIDAYRTDATLKQFADRREQFEQRNAVTLASVRTMAEAGVTILTGTDAGNWGTIQGYSLHRELVKLVSAGLTPWQALAASTTEAGEFLGHSFGVNAGDEANLVVLNVSPTDDIHNTQRIALVIHHGVIVDRDALLTLDSGKTQ